MHASLQRADLRLVNAAVAATEIASESTQPLLEPRVPPVVIPEAVEANILGRLLALAREIRQPRRYIGYSFLFFLLFLKGADRLSGKAIPGLT